MQVAQDFLIGANQEYPDVIVFLGNFSLCTGRKIGQIFRRNEVSVFRQIAGDILQRRNTVRLLIEPVDRHDRKDLVDRPEPDVN